MSNTAQQANTLKKAVPFERERLCASFISCREVDWVERNHFPAAARSQSPLHVTNLGDVIHSNIAAAESQSQQPQVVLTR